MPQPSTLNPQPNPLELDVHPASEAERVEIFRNVHDVWGGGLSLEFHLERRLVSAQHQRAEWFAGVQAGRVVTSLGCYPLEFRVHRGDVPGFAIGAVHTIAEFRGRGLAPRLLRAVEEVQTARGSRLAMLFTDIGTAYYERLGYVAGRSHEGSASVEGLEPFRGRLVDAPAADYDEWRESCVGRRALVIHRGPDYAAHLLAKVPGQRRWLVENAAGAIVGGFSLSPRGERAERAAIEEHFSWNDTGEPLVFRAILEAAAGIGAESVAGWMPDVPATRATFDVRPRDSGQTMIKPLDRRMWVGADVLVATDWLNGVDHV